LSISPKTFIFNYKKNLEPKNRFDYTKDNSFPQLSQKFSFPRLPFKYLEPMEGLEPTTC
jgi:hypothetical protein